MGSGGWVVAGLGNPGSRYQRTRHNAGFLFLDALVDGVSPSSRWRNQFKGETHSVALKGEELFLIKPQTFMNLSGEAVQECLSFRKMKPEQLIVVHDEIDIPFGDIRLKKGGGSGGHNGLKSITEKIASPEYYRIRLGVGRPGAGSDNSEGVGHKHPDVSAHVLSSFSAEESANLAELLARATKVLETLVSSGLVAAQRVCNRPIAG